MTTNGGEPLHQLGELISDGALTIRSLEEITGVNAARWERLLPVNSEASDFPVRHDRLGPNEVERVSLLAAALTYGAQIDDDDRLKAIYEGLTISFAMTPSALAALLDVSADDITAALDTPSALPADRKVRLALRGQWLVSVINQVRPRLALE